MSELTGGAIKNRFLCVLCLSLLATAGAAFAHHSSAMFDGNKVVTLVGEIKEFDWTNPHCAIVIEVPDGKGGVAEWSVEGGSPNTMVNHGWRRSILKPGDKVSITIFPLKNGEKGGTFLRCKFPDGREMVMFENPKVIQ